MENNIGTTTKTVTVTLPNHQGTRTVDIPITIYPTVTAKNPVRDHKGRNLTNGTDVYNYIIFENNNRLEEQLLGKTIVNLIKHSRCTKFNCTC